MPASSIQPDPDAIRQALKLAARLDLPVTARSLTAAEMAAIDRRQWGCLVAPFGALGLWLAFFLVYDPPRQEGDALVIAAMLLALPVLLWLATRWRFRKPSAYVDPNVVVEVTKDGVAIALDGRLHRLDFSEAAARFGHALRGRGGTFRGIVLNLPGRPVEFGAFMLNGWNAAAMVVAGIVAAGIWPDPRES